MEIGSLQKLLAFVFSGWILSGCGGGGGSGSTAPPTYTVGGTISGLSGTGLTLRNNGGSDLTISSNGTFVFSTAVASGASFNITVQTQPTATPGQVCSVGNGTGTITNAAITSVAVICRNLVGRFLYVPNRTSGTVSAFAIDASTGALTPLAGSPFSGAGTQPGGTAVDPNGKFLYLSGSNVPTTSTGTLAGFSIDSTTGALTAISGMPINITMGAPFTPALSPSGNLLILPTYVGLTGYLYGYQVDPVTGVLTNLGGSPYATGIPYPPVFEPTGTYFYVPTAVRFPSAAGSINIYTISGMGSTLSPVGAIATTSQNPVGATINSAGTVIYTPGLTSNVIEAFNVNASNGLLTAVSGSPFTTGQGPIGAALSRDGRFLYVSNSGVTFAPPPPLTGPGSISAFSVSSTTGALTSLPGSPYATGGDFASSPIIDPTGKFLTATNTASGTIALYLIDSTTGVLTPIVGSPFAPAVGTTPGVPTIDPSGRFAYVTDTNSNSISAYVYSSTTNTLTFVGSYTTGTGPVRATIVGLQ